MAGKCHQIWIRDYYLQICFASLRTFSFNKIKITLTDFKRVPLELFAPQFN